MPKRYPFTPALGWSVTRYDTFTICKREYYYQYYTKYERDVPQQRLAFLKMLTSIPLEVGNVVHDTIATLLHRLRRSTAPINTNDVFAYSYNMIDRAAENKPFYEVHYGGRERIDPEDLKVKVAGCLQNFFDSKRYSWLFEDAVLHKDQWLIEPADFGEIRVNGLKAYCKVDFLFPTKDGTLYVLDWKTGGSNVKKHTRQMKGYMLYARQLNDTDPLQVKPVVAYLSGRYSELEIPIFQGDLDDFAAAISSETREMHEYCSNIEENIPKPKEAFTPQQSALCAYCNYREICDK